MMTSASEEAPGLDGLVARIEAGGPVSDDDLIRALSPGSLEARRQANFRLHLAFTAVGKDRQALWCAQRAWFLGHRDPRLLVALYNDGANRRSQPDTLGVLREGIVSAVEAGDPVTACDLLVFYHSALSSLGLPIHDPIVVPPLIRLLRAPPSPRRSPGRPLRVGYLFWGETYENNVLPPILLDIARHHDRTRFQPFFFSGYPLEHLRRLNTLAPLVAAAESMGATLEGNETVGGFHHRAQTLSAMIAARAIDTLIVLGQHDLNFLVAAIHPAPLVVGLDTGDPHGYGSPALDHIIVPSGARHVMEVQCDATQVRGAYTKHSPVPPAAVDRAELLAGPDDVLIMTSGASNKFQSPDYLRMLGEVVAECPGVRLVVIGPDRSDAVGQAIGRLFAPQALARTVLTGYRTDFAALIRAADIYVDTYPVGGGYSVFEVLTAGIATVTFGEKLEGLFNKIVHYAPAAKFLDGTDIVVPGDDVGHMKRRLLDMIASPDLRHSLGLLGQQVVKPMLDRGFYTSEIEQVLYRRAYDVREP